jgi:hypothetical protein
MLCAYFADGSFYVPAIISVQVCGLLTLLPASWRSDGVVSSVRAAQRVIILS